MALSKYSKQWDLLFQDAEKITFSDYLLEKEKKLNKAKGDLEKATSKCLDGMLKGTPGFLEEGEETDEYVKNLMTVPEYAIGAHSDPIPESISTINSRAKHYRHVVRSPAIAHITKSPLNERDEEIANSQAEDFVRLYPELAGGAKETIVHYFNDPMEGSMLDKLKNFFEETGQNYLQVVLVFMGHGSATGMCFRDQKPDVPINGFLTALEEKVLRDLGETPKYVEIILTQCFAHLFKEPDVGDIFVNVICFTTDAKPLTNYLPIIDSGGNQTGWYHKQLRVFCKKLAKGDPEEEQMLTDTSGGAEPMEA